MINQYHMKGGGYYNAHSTPQHDAMYGCLPWLLEAVASMKLPADKQLRTLDVGCSQGANSVDMLKQLVAKLREAGATSIQPSLADLPSNDFNSVFENLFPGGDNVFGGTDVLPAAIGGSAYERLAPTQSLHVVTTFNMLGWRKQPPVTRLRNTIAAFHPTPYAEPHGPQADPAAIDAAVAEAKPDLVDFFRARAEELVPGGKMLVQIFGSSDDGGNTAHGWLDALNDVLFSLIDEGKLTQQAMDDFTFPVVWRTLAELKEPLENEPDLRAAFTIEKADSWEVPVDFNVRYEESGNLQNWAHEYTEVFRAVTETTLAGIFPEETCEALIDEVYKRIETRFAEDPVRYQFHFYSIAVLLTRN
ncbi:hypothetical protein [Cerasicoccus fimbriatus]|uniref:hypothetical protein n=1 Tax=Cerasicoccus fimbriatus TaxID=3014554 RepID=UPI0022B35CDD|nr:hypothetical protein [Cerasicoccus sp. TK19100]